MKTFIGFWAIYLLLFVIGLPLLIYYVSDEDMRYAPMPSAATAFFYLGLGLLLWTMVFIFFCRYFLINVFRARQRILNIITHGDPFLVKVLSKTIKASRPGYEVLSLQISFTNLRQTPVSIPYEVNDTKPDEKRFEPGQTLRMRAMPDTKNPVLILESAQVSLNKGVLLTAIIGLLLILTFAIGYLLFAYEQESMGTGWRFLRFWHPWIIIPLSALFFGGIIALVLKGINRMAGTSKELMKLVFYGKRTMGTILHYAETGVYINEQPRIKFEVQFTDERGQLHNASFQKVISLLELHQLSKGAKEVLYLPDNPKEFIFYEDLSAE
ncbi:hypothetical protein DBR32_12445 [Taibaiella sp. KBW10]|nr:hypothetical protein DBR32_12445 [Taibaiella sp. KBW10]